MLGRHEGQSGWLGNAVHTTFEGMQTETAKHAPLESNSALKKLQGLRSAYILA